MKITKMITRSGAILNFDSVARYPRCGAWIPLKKIACIACLPEAATKRKKVKPDPVKPDQDSLFEGVPGVEL